jgi:hypothetical protein
LFLLFLQSWVSVVCFDSKNILNSISHCSCKERREMDSISALWFFFPFYVWCWYYVTPSFVNPYYLNFIFISILDFSFSPLTLSLLLKVWLLLIAFSTFLTFPNLYMLIFSFVISLLELVIEVDVLIHSYFHIIFISFFLLRFKFLLVSIGFWTNFDFLISLLILFPFNKNNLSSSLICDTLYSFSFYFFASFSSPPFLFLNLTTTATPSSRLLLQPAGTLFRRPPLEPKDGPQFADCTSTLHRWLESNEHVRQSAC